MMILDEEKSPNETKAWREGQKEETGGKSAEKTASKFTSHI